MMVSIRVCPFCGEKKDIGTLRMYQEYVDHLESHAEDGGNGTE